MKITMKAKPSFISEEQTVKDLDEEQKKEYKVQGVKLLKYLNNIATESTEKFEKEFALCDLDVRVPKKFRIAEIVEIAKQIESLGEDIYAAERVDAGFYWDIKRIVAELKSLTDKKSLKKSEEKRIESLKQEKASIEEKREELPIKDLKKQVSNLKGKRKLICKEHYVEKDLERELDDYLDREFMYARVVDLIQILNDVKKAACRTKYIKDVLNKKIEELSKINKASV